VSFLQGGGSYRPRSRSRSRSPMPQAGGSSVSFRSQRGSMSAARSVQGPDAFSRHPSQAVQYTYFDPIAILHNLNYLEDKLPPLPNVLTPHDVYWEDWEECLEEISRAWLSKRVDGRKRSKLVARILDVWNSFFFVPRGVELVLFKGAQRRSGPQNGAYDPVFGGIDDTTSDDSDSDSVISDSDYDQSFGYYWNDKRYGNDPWMMNTKEAKRARREAHRRKQKEKRRRSRSRHAVSRDQPYRLVLTCLGGNQNRLMGRSPRSPYRGGISLI